MSAHRGSVFIRKIVLWMSMVAVSSGAFAQAPPMPIFPTVDANGVELASGRFYHAVTDVSIGEPGAGGLDFTRIFTGNSWTHNHFGYLMPSGGKCMILIGAFIETFNGGCDSQPLHDQQTGSYLSGNSAAGYTYKGRDGVTVFFTPVFAGIQTIQGMPANIAGYLSTITMPSGLKTEYAYETGAPTCYPSPQMCYYQTIISRLSYIHNNAGYYLALQYTGVPGQGMWPHTVKGINRAVEFCSGANCTMSWPYAQFTFNGFYAYTSATTGLGLQAQYSYSGANLIEIQYPDDPNHDVNISYSSGRVSNVDLGFGAWGYGYVDAGANRTTTVTNPDATSSSFVTEISSGRMLSATNELGQEVTYTFDAAKRVTRVTMPLGNFTQLTLDSRGNVTETRQVSNQPGFPDLVTSAVFPSGCSNFATCNLPTSTTDARGYRTDYTYDSAHGGLLTVTAPAPSGASPVGSGTRPQTRFSYSQFQARYRSSASSYMNGTLVWKMTGSSTCATGSTPACIGTSDEAVASISYPGTGTPNNLAPVSSTRSTGSGSPSRTEYFTYTNWGDLKTVDGPVAGSSDTTRLYYDSGRRVTGVVEPDPDGGGPLLFRAARLTYNAVGQTMFAERGTVTSQADGAFSTFVTLESSDVLYDSFARPTMVRTWDGPTVATAMQTSYDSRGRVLCEVQRMNPTYFSSLPDACTLTPVGSFGADRIFRGAYNAAGQITAVHSAYGTAAQQTTASYTYTANGRVETLTDARGYRTGYSYDGHDRLVRLSYPDPVNQNQWSSTDFESVLFDAYGRVEQERRRSGEVFYFSYDNLNRITGRDAPGAQPDASYGYDLMSRLTSESLVGGLVRSLSYNALSEVSSETSSTLGAISYLYDGAGRRSRTTYPDGFYVTYGYDAAGGMTGVYENGSTALATYAYDNLGRRISFVRGNGVLTTYSFDAVSRLTSLSHDAAGSSHDVSFVMTYSPAGQMVSRTRTNASYDWILPASYSEAYAADGQNRYSSARGVMPTYDTRGNLTGDGSSTYSFDADNKIIAASGGIGVGYDPAGRIYQVSGGTTVRFLHDGSEPVAEYDASGSVVRRYVHGSGVDEPLVWYEGAGTADRRWLLADERGSIIGSSNASGLVTQVNRYDADGVPSGSNQGRFQYTGQMWVPELNLYHYKARAYHPRLGRFMQTDPIGFGGGLNLYAYVGGDPVNSRDPSGLCGIPILTADFGAYWSNQPARPDEMGETGTYRTWRVSEMPHPFCDLLMRGSAPAPSGSGGGSGGGTSSGSPEAQATSVCTYAPLSKADAGIVSAAFADSEISSALELIRRLTLATGREHAVFLYQDGAGALRVTNGYRGLPREQLSNGQLGSMGGEFTRQFALLRLAGVNVLASGHGHPSDAGSGPSGSNKHNEGDISFNRWTGTIGIIASRRGFTAGRLCQ